HEEHQENGKHHLHVRVGTESEHAENQELYELESRKGVDLPLGDSTDVVVGWIGSLDLFCEEQQKPVEELVAIESRDGHVQKQAVQHRPRNVGQRAGQQKHGQTDHHVGHDARNTRLPHVDDS
ncbi:hypothetical protein EGW08_012976, partial [Elysia chlorotica]